MNEIILPEGRICMQMPVLFRNGAQSNLRLLDLNDRAIFEFHLHSASFSTLTLFFP